MRLADLKLDQRKILAACGGGSVYRNGNGRIQHNPRSRAGAVNGHFRQWCDATVTALVEAGLVAEEADGYFRPTALGSQVLAGGA